MILDELNSLKVGFVSHKDHGIDSTTPSGKLMLAVVGAFAAYEKEIIRQRVMSGLEKARADGIRFGRPRRDFDLKPILLLIKEGNGLKAISRMLNLPRATIRRRLVETGNWGVSKNPSKKKA
jgi:DNA invertase Pin-like site-specific DNA recombinase